jgi:hypothetical protein
MNQHGSWSPYTGISSLVLALFLFLVTGVLIFLALRLRRPIAFKRPGRGVGIALSALLVVWVVAFLVAVSIYVLALEQQLEHQRSSVHALANPITPVTLTSAVIAFLVIIFLTQRSGDGVAFGSAIVGTIAAPMIFELPFDLIVMWRTYPPAPAIPFTLLFFVPLFLIEITSFALLTLSPLMRVSRQTLFCLAGMFLVFAIWALFGFAYPSAPIPIALNMISKVLAFATAVSLFLPLAQVQAAANSAAPETTSKVEEGQPAPGMSSTSTDLIACGAAKVSEKQEAGG